LVFDLFLNHFNHLASSSLSRVPLVSAASLDDKLSIEEDEQVEINEALLP
jgi:hypothetical protein